MIKYIKPKYIPIFITYFAYSLVGFTSIAVTKIERDILSLSPEILAALAVFIALPWSIKMIFGSLIDSIKLFGNNRKSYIVLGQLCIALSTTLFIDVAVAGPLITALGAKIAWVLAGFTYSLGAVISDISADIMAIDLVDDKESEELGAVQVLSRIFLGAGAVIGAGLAYLLEQYGWGIVSILQLEYIAPLIVIIAIYFSPKVDSSVTPLNKKLVFGGLLYGVLAIFGGAYLDVEVIFFLSIVFISLLLVPLLKKMDNWKYFVFAMLGIFLYRATPGIGAGVTWWVTNGLGLGDLFLGKLRIISSISGFVVLTLLAKVVARGSVAGTLGWLTVFGTLLGLPEILVYYEMLGPPSTVLMFDTALGAPLGQLSMIPLGILIARNAPQNELGSYTTVTASLMNLASMGGSILTKWLNGIYDIKRDDFSQLGELMISSLSIGTVMSVVGVIIIIISTKVFVKSSDKVIKG
jgi:MFS family permease